MAFDVGAVVGRLELDKRKWEQSIEAVKRDQTSLSGFVLRNENQIKNFGKALTIGGAAITGFFGLLIKGTVDAGDYINDLSERTGIGTETLSAYKLAADKSGTSLEGVAVGMKNLANEMKSANDGGKESIRLFDELDVSYVDNTGKLRPLDEVMLDVADKFAAMEDGAEKSNLAWKVFGKTGTEMIPLLNMGRKGLEENAEAARRLGSVWSAEAARKADEFNDSLVELKAGLAGTGKEIVLALLPAVKTLVQGITDIATKVRVWMAEHPTLTGWISKTALGVGVLMTAVGPLLIMLPKLVKGFQAFQALDVAGKLKGMNFAFLGVVGGILAAGAAVDWLINKYKAHQDAEMQAFVKSMGPVREAFLMRRELIKAQVVSHEEWRDIFEKSGRDYETMLKMISTDPAYAKLKAEWDEIKKNLSAVDKVTLGVTDVFKQFGLKTRTELTKELKDARTALDDLRKSGEATPGAIKTLEDRVKDLSDKLHGASAAQKTFGEVMKEWGILPIKDKADRISTLLGYEAKLDEWLKAGKIDLTEWGQAIRKANEELQSLGSQTVNKVLPAARDFHDLIAKMPSKLEDVAYKAWTFEGALRDIADQAMVSEATVLRFLWNTRAEFLRTMGIMIPKWPEFSDAAGTMASETGGMLDGLFNDIATGFSNTIQNWVSGASTFRDFMKGLWGDIKASFFRMVGEMATKWAVGLVKDMVGGTAKMASEVGKSLSSVASTVTTVASSIGTVITTLATAIGTAIGAIATGIAAAIVTLATAIASAATILAAAIVPLVIVGAFAVALFAAFKLVGGVIDKILGAGGISSTVGGWIHESRNYLAEIRNWLFSAGTGFGGASYEFITGHLGVWLGGIKSSIDETRGALWEKLEHIRLTIENIPGGQRGLVMSSPGLVMTHGTPAAPEVIAPVAELRRILATVGPSEAAGRRGPAEVNITNEVHLDGMIITDREYTRKRLIPEIMDALDSNYLKSGFQEKLGIA